MLLTTMASSREVSLADRGTLELSVQFCQERGMYSAHRIFMVAQHDFTPKMVVQYSVQGDSGGRVPGLG